MNIYSVYDEEFRPYGKVIKDFESVELVDAMKKIEMPKEGTAYEPSIASLEACSCFKEFTDSVFGGILTQGYTLYN